MCAEAKSLIAAFLDVIEESDRLDLMSIAASRRDDPGATEGYRGLSREARLTLQVARGRLQEHQKAHNCFEAVHFDDLNA
jgi:hypothetical protein